MVHRIVDDFLSEIGEINGFIDDVLASPRRIHWHWPSYYLMYVELDRMALLLLRAAYLFEPPSASFGEASIVAEYVEDANELFARIGKQQKSIVQWLWQMSRNTTPIAADPARHERLDAHVHPKSGWFQTFMQEFNAGVISGDGKTLWRSVLPVDRAASCDRISHPAASCMLRTQSFDLGTPEANLALARAANEVRIKIGRILAAMRVYLVENCTIDDLLHPSSR